MEKPASKPRSFAGTLPRSTKITDARAVMMKNILNDHATSLRERGGLGVPISKRLKRFPWEERKSTVVVLRRAGVERDGAAL